MNTSPKLPSWYLFVLVLLCFSQFGWSQNNVMIGTPTYETILEPSFENPGAWTFTGIAALVNRGNAPSGSKVLGLRGQATANQNISIPNDGCFRFDIQAAQASTSSSNSFRIFIDGIEVLEATPPNTNFTHYFSVAFTLTAGTHAIQIAGIQPTAAAQFFDDIQLTNLPCWSTPANWSQNTVPDAADTAVINTGDVLVLNTNGNCAKIYTEGQILAANNLNLTLDAALIMIDQSTALLEWGQTNTPYEVNGQITLIGNIAQAAIGQTAALMIMNGAELQLHGQVRDSWTRLNVTALQGSSQITLEKAMDWQVGDSIVIASTDFNAHQAEVRAISSVSGGGTVFHFNDTLQYLHYGEIQTYPNSPTTSVLDERAEVGLLTRNLVIRGDADSQVDKAGGHIMVMANSFAQVSGVELFQMGQEGILGRYPFHWHLTGDLTGQYIKNSSIHISYNRVLTVHSSSNGLIEDNVAYDHIGNGYFLENGDETGNQFMGNLGILTRAALPGKEVRIYDRLPSADPSLPFLRLPATFWITHPSNDFVGNVCAGSEGSGFWMTVQHTPIEGNNPDNIFPRFEPLGLFDDNVSHSTSFSNFAIDLRVVHDVVPDTHKIIDSGNYLPPNTPVINNFTSYKCSDRAIWMRTNSLDFEKCASGDNGRSTFFSYHNVIRNSLYVGLSANVGTQSAWSNNETAAARSLPVPQVSMNSLVNHFRGHPLYDGPSGLENCHFADFTGTNSSIFTPNTAATKSTVHFARQASFTNVPTVNKFSNLFSQDKDFQWTTGIIDLDGTLDNLTNPGDFIKPKIYPINNPDRRLYDEGFNVEVGATFVPEWDHYICTEEHYGLLLMFNNVDPSRKFPIYSIRSDGPATITEGQDSKNQIPVIVSNPNYRYYLQYHRIPDELEFILKFLNQNDVVTFVLLNVPSTSLISKNGGSISTFASLDAFNNSGNEGYFLDNNTLYVRLKGTSQHNVAQFGDEFPYTSNIKVCQYANCQRINAVGTFEVPLADFENGLDERASLATSGNLTLGNITADLPSASNSFGITSDGDGIDEYVEYRLAFHRQVWSEFNNLEMDFTGPTMEVLLHDQSEGDIPLGFYQSTSCYSFDLTRLSKEQIDEVDALVIRVRESDLGDLNQNGLSATIQLNEILLDYSRDLWDFHRNAEDWKAVGANGNAANIDSVNNGLLYFTKNESSGRLSIDLFKGKPTIKPEDNPSLILRMKPTSGLINSGTFFHYPWGGSWINGPNFALNTLNQFNHYVLNPPWASFDMQRIMFSLMNGPSGSAEVDYIRLTDCPTCYNNQLDSNEVFVDCGGPICPPCSCEDGIQNNDETGIDCGGSCPDCSELVFENGRLNGISDDWVTVNLTNTYNDPVVIATVKLVNILSSPVVTRIQNITGNSFELRVQNPGDGNAGTHQVHYFVVEAGVYTEAIDGINMEAWTENSSSTASSGNWIFENRSTVNSYSNPVILGQVQTFNDSRWSVFWASETGLVNAPPAAGNAFSGGKHVAQDSQTVRLDESIGFLAIEAGLYELDEQLLEAGVGIDNVKGTQNASSLIPFPYFLSIQLDIEGAVLSSAAMDGGDGGWPVLFTNNPTPGNRLYCAIDEDTISDPERSHTTEQVAYLAFGTHSTTPGLWPWQQQEYVLQLKTTPPKSNPEESDQAFTLQLFPNPVRAGQKITMQFSNQQIPDLSNLTITNANGKTQEFSWAKESNALVHIEAQLAPGIYFVALSHQEGISVEKLIVTRQ